MLVGSVNIMKRILFNLLTVILVIIIVIATVVGFSSLFVVIDEKVKF